MSEAVAQGRSLWADARDRLMRNRAAMASLIVFTSAIVTGLFFVIEWWLIRRTQRWRNPARD